jgi:hypothetical protein
MKLPLDYKLKGMKLRWFFKGSAAARIRFIKKNRALNALWRVDNLTLS